MSGLKERLEQVLRRPTETVADAERAARAAEALAVYLGLEERVSRLVDEEQPDDQRGARRPTERSFHDVTLHVAAEHVLREANVPLHVRELGRRIKARGWRHKRSADPRPDQILYQLAARLPRYPAVFVRVAPNTFGLREWDTAARKPPRPRVGLFDGPGKTAARELGDHPDLPAAATKWRSS